MPGTFSARDAKGQAEASDYRKQVTGIGSSLYGLDKQHENICPRKYEMEAERMAWLSSARVLTQLRRDATNALDKAHGHARR